MGHGTGKRSESIPNDLRAEAIQTLRKALHTMEKLHRLTNMGGKVFHALVAFQAVGLLTLHPTGVRYEEKAQKLACSIAQGCQLRVSRLRGDLATGTSETDPLSNQTILYAVLYLDTRLQRSFLRAQRTCHSP